MVASGVTPMAPLIVLMLSVVTACGSFLGGLKLGDPIQLNPSKLDPMIFRRNELDELALPSAVASPAESALAAQREDMHSSFLVFAEGPPKANKVTKDTKQVFTDAGKKGANAAGEKSPDRAAKKVGDKAVRRVKKIVEDNHPERQAGGAVRGATSWMAKAINQTSSEAAELLHSFVPKASDMLRHWGEFLACKLRGDCRQSDEKSPFDPRDLESWALLGFLLLLASVLCLASVCGVKCMHKTCRKGTVLLSEAAVPLKAPSARELTIQMASSPQAAI